MTIQIQTIMYEDKGLRYKTHYWMKEDELPAKKIRKDKWFELHYLPDTEVLAPLTKEM